MRKVEIFSSTSAAILQNKINTWLNEGDGLPVAIESIHYSAAMSDVNGVCYSVMIYYTV
jgi:hypothetical protein